MSIAANKRAARLFRKVAKGITTIANDEETYGEDKDMYQADAKDHRELATWCDQNNPCEATTRYEEMDTASQDYFFEFLNKEQAAWLDSYLEA